MTDGVTMAHDERIPRRVALLFGGVSPEHEISILSASKVIMGLGAMPEAGELTAQAIYINREGQWVFWQRNPGDTRSDEEKVLDAPNWELADENPPLILEFPEALAELRRREIEVAMPILHGPGGEDGKLQGAFDLMGLPYTGSGAGASALALHKPHAQAVFNAAGLRIPRSTSMRVGSEPQALTSAVEKLIEVIGLPCVVKPGWGGSSVGISIVHEADSLASALDRAAQIDDEVMIETFIAGREFTCGVLERGGAPMALPVTEIIPPEGRFFDYDAKYEPGVSREVTPAEIDETLTKEIQRLAHRAHNALGCRGFSRTDFIVDAQGQPYVIELNTIPGMTQTSLLPQAAAIIGLGFPALLRQMLLSATYDR